MMRLNNWGKYISKMFREFAGHHLAHWSVAVCVVLFLLFSWLALPVQKLGDYPMFNSPDETANYLFSQRFAKAGKFVFDDPFATVSRGYILPRSVQLVFNQVTPTAFVGLPLIYGFAAKFVGVDWLLFFTPLLMALAVVSLYWALWVNFDKRFAWLTAVLIFANPAWFYNATRPMMTIGLFMAFVMMAVAGFLLAMKYQRSVLYAAAGVFSGLALLVRASEAIWLFALAVLLIIIYRQRVYWLGLVVSVLCVLPSLALIGTYNYNHFASPWQFGYNHVVAEPSRAFIRTVLFPFGVDLAKSWQHFYNYTFILFSCWTILALVALVYAIYLLIKAKRTSYWLYFLATIGIVGYLIIYYGSWTFFDNPRADAVTIGNSYVRYYLPIIILFSPLIALLLTAIKNKLAFGLLTIAVFGSLFFSTYQSAWLGVDEGVMVLKNTINEYQEIRSAVLRLTPAGSIIIAGKMDKVFYPFRRVYAGTIDWQVVEKHIYVKAPVYLLSRPMSEVEISSKQNELKTFNLKLGSEVKLVNNFSLYQVSRIHEQAK